MSREKMLYGLIGILLGMIIGYLGTDSLNRNGTTASASAPPAAAMPR